MVVLARQEVRLDKHTRLDSPESQKCAIHMHEYDVGALVCVVRILIEEEAMIFLARSV